MFYYHSYCYCFCCYFRDSTKVPSVVSSQQYSCSGPRTVRPRVRVETMNDRHFATRQRIKNALNRRRDFLLLFLS